MELLEIVELCFLLTIAPIEKLVTDQRINCMNVITYRPKIKTFEMSTFLHRDHTMCKLIILILVQ